MRQQHPRPSVSAPSLRPSPSRASGVSPRTAPLVLSPASDTCRWVWETGLRGPETCAHEEGRGGAGELRESVPHARGPAAQPADVRAAGGGPSPPWRSAHVPPPGC